jgi:hypothetical protein
VGGAGDRGRGGAVEQRFAVDLAERIFVAVEQRFGELVAFGERFGKFEPIGERFGVFVAQRFGKQEPFAIGERFGKFEPIGERVGVIIAQRFGKQEPFAIGERFGKFEPIGERIEVGKRQRIGELIAQRFGERVDFAERFAFAERAASAGRGADNLYSRVWSDGGEPQRYIDINAQADEPDDGGEMTVSRKVKESPLYQGVDEQIAYQLTTTPWGSSPGSVAVTLKDAEGVDMSATCLSGSASVSGDVITTPTVKSLIAGQKYRLEVKFTVSGNIVEAWTEIWGEV